MRRVTLAGSIAALLWLQPGLMLAMDNGLIFCGSGLFHNESTCSPTACTGTLIPTCSAPEGFSSGSVAITFVQGVCDDLGPVLCDGKFKYYFEGCGGTRHTFNNLNNTRGAGIFRICYDPTGAGQCTGVGTEILKGSLRSETFGIGSAPWLAQADHTFSTSKAFTFNGKNRRLTVKHGFAISSSESGGCTTPECGFGGCLYKTQ